MCFLGRSVGDGWMEERRDGSKYGSGALFNFCVCVFMGVNSVIVYPR